MFITAKPQKVVTVESVPETIHCTLHELLDSNEWEGKCDAARKKIYCDWLRMVPLAMPPLRGLVKS